MTTPPQACHYCDQPAVVYCDKVVFGRAPLDIGVCSRPLCHAHRRKVGNVCDRSRRTKNNQSDTIDHCREHP